MHLLLRDATDVRELSVFEEQQVHVIRRRTDLLPSFIGPVLDHVDVGLQGRQEGANATNEREKVAHTGFVRSKAHQAVGARSRGHVLTRDGRGHGAPTLTPDRLRLHDWCAVVNPSRVPAQRSSSNPSIPLRKAATDRRWSTIFVCSRASSP